MNAGKIIEVSEEQQKELTGTSTRNRTKPIRYNPTEIANEPQWGSAKVPSVYAVTNVKQESEESTKIKLETKHLEEIMKTTPVVLKAGEKIDPEYKIPNTVWEALSCKRYPQWKGAICKELMQMLSTGTFKEMKTEELDKNDISHRQIGMKWVFNVKTMENPVRFKARLCAQGFMQDEMTIGATFSPTAKSTTAILLCMIALKNELNLNVMDIEGAFLKAELPQPLLSKTPKGVYIDEDKVIRIEKSIYGLKEAPRLFGTLLKSILKEIGLVESIMDECLCYKLNSNPKNNVFVGIHVDDLLIAGPDGFAEELSKKLKESKGNLIGKTSELEVYLGKRYKYNKENGVIEISVVDHIDELVKNYDNNNVTVDIPLKQSLELEKDESMDESYPFRQILGRLNYISQTRWDIKYAVHYLSKFQNCYGKTHYEAAIHLTRYLKKTRLLGPRIEKDQLKDFKFNVETDSDWAGDKNTSVSTQGIVLKIGNVPFGAKIVSDKSVAMSTNEAEVRAIGSCTKEIEYFRELLRELGMTQVGSTIVYTDSQGAIDLIKKDRHTEQQKHIRLHIHKIKNLCERGIMTVKHVKSELNRADILTKKLKLSTHSKLCRRFPGLSNEFSESSPSNYKKLNKLEEGELEINCYKS